MLSPNDVLDQPHSQSQTSARLSASPLNLEGNQKTSSRLELVILLEILEIIESFIANYNFFYFSTSRFS